MVNAGLLLQSVLGSASCEGGSGVDYAINARSRGVRGDGQTDDTAALQGVMDACGQGGGGIVQLPRGTYVLRGTLTVPAYVTLQGVFAGPSAGGEGKGTTLHAYAGRGTEEGPAFITLEKGATLKGVAVYYPEQSGDPVTPYPWCVAGAGEDVTVADCLLVNPYQGIDMGTQGCPRHFISRVYSYPLRRGLFVDQCFDIGRVENVHFWPFWRVKEHGAQVRAFVQAHGEAFIFAMTDWQYVFNTFCWGYKVGYRFTENGRGVCNGNFLGIGADACNACVQVDNSAAYGVLITNGQFVALYGVKPTQIVVGPEHSGTVQFNNCSFWGPCHQCVRVEGKGFVSFQQCHFLEWNPARGSAPCIQIDGGTFSVNGNRFAKAAEAIRAGKGVRGGVVTGNLFAGADAVQVEGNAPVRVEANGFEPEPVDEAPGSKVISVLGPQVVIEGDWWDYAGRGSYTGVSYFSVQREQVARFRWNFGLERAETCTVSAWVPRWVAPAHGEGRARYRIRHAHGEETVEVVQSQHAEAWVALGQFALDSGSYVDLENAPGETVIADCVLLTKTVRKGG